VPLARTHSVALVGVTGHVVEVEADIANGLVGTILVGLPDAALREARDRIRAAIVNSGEEWPQRKITVALSPASLPKRGSWFDLRMQVGVFQRERRGKAEEGSGASPMRLGRVAGKARTDGLGACCPLRPLVALARGGWLVLRCYRWRG
jgi:hypothetical protein